MEKQKEREGSWMEGTISAKNFLRCICAAHLTSYVESPFNSAGGVMLIAAPEALKTSFLNVLERYQNSFPLSDINVKTLNMMRMDISSGHLRTLYFPKFRKIYERNPQTALNLEGQLRALVDEGFRAASFEDQRVRGITARCMIMGAMTEDLYRTKFDGWQKSGFTRRFLWAMYRLKDPDVLIRAVEKWQKLDFGPIDPLEIPVSGTIPQQLTEQERRWILAHLKYQPGGKAIPFQLCCKILSVLKWNEKRQLAATNGTKTHVIEATSIMKEFFSLLSRDGGVVIL
jgi:hypothetical protein